ncbi:hypothetical protein AOLI_G00249470 [Acnodon oligacanthus]
MVNQGPFEMLRCLKLLQVKNRGPVGCKQGWPERTTQHSLHHCHCFMPMLEECGITSTENNYNSTRRDWSPLQYFQQYTDVQLIRDLSVFTNQRMVQDLGCSLNTTPEEIKTFLGI